MQCLLNFKFWQYSKKILLFYFFFDFFAAKHRLVLEQAAELDRLAQAKADADFARKLHEEMNAAPSPDPPSNANNTLSDEELARRLQVGNPTELFSSSFWTCWFEKTLTVTMAMITKVFASSTNLKNLFLIADQGCSLPNKSYHLSGAFSLVEFHKFSDLFFIEVERVRAIFAHPMFVVS